MARSNTPKHLCQHCGRMVTPWKWTGYLRRHKADGAWCPGGNRTASGN